MEGLSLTQRMMQEPALRASLEKAQTPEQQLSVLRAKGFSDSEINTARQTTKFSTHMYQGKLSSFE